MIKLKIELTQNYILENELRFNSQAKINSFYEKYIYYSQNINSSMNIIYQMGSNLNASPVNLWKEESELMNYFIISDEDFENIEVGKLSNEVKFVQKLINKQQTIIDSKKDIISTKIIIIRFSTFKDYIESRNKIN